MKERLGAAFSMALFLILSGYVLFSAFRLALVLWQLHGPG
jgi:hypothetical protein